MQEDLFYIKGTRQRDFGTTGVAGEPPLPDPEGQRLDKQTLSYKKKITANVYTFRHSSVSSSME